MNGILALGILVIAIRLTSSRYLKKRRKFEIHQLNKRLENSEIAVNELTDKLNQMIKDYERKEN